ncbi:hypothetical protein J7416_14490 [Ruegeria sp. R14_0]|nr:hypothetical protein [Ruegeria sp. R14_0]
MTNVIPGLVESVEASDDGLEYPLNLHQGVKFHSNDLNRDGAALRDGNGRKASNRLQWRHQPSEDLILEARKYEQAQRAFGCLHAAVQRGAGLQGSSHGRPCFLRRKRQTEHHSLIGAAPIGGSDYPI